MLEGGRLKMNCAETMVAHRNDAGATEPVARLLDDPNFPCTGCVDGVQVMTYVNRRAIAEKKPGQVSHCVVPALTKSLNNNIRHIKELERFYQEAVTQCSH